ncbi:MAG: hypothetical protein J6W10_06520 [Kiritimatiellae bacterium]|nr:hypothetical protein [Kiritimatiellia bacterium]
MAPLMATYLSLTAVLSVDALPSIHPQAIEEAIPLALKAIESLRNNTLK